MGTGGTTGAYAFDPGTLPPGAQSLGEHESVVSHTNPRVSRAAVTLLDRLVQATWTEPLQEDPRNQGISDDPHTDDADMQVDNDNASERTAMSIDRVPAEVQANTPATTGGAGEEHENGSTHPSRSQYDAEEAQEGRNCRNTESPLEDRHAETQASNMVDLDEHWMGGTDHAQSAAPSADVGNPFESEGISPTVPFTHPDVSSTIGEGGEDALGSTPWPDHTEEGNGRLNAAEDTNYTADENRPGHVHAPNTEHTSRLTHTERGGQPGHDSPDPYAGSSESSRNPTDANKAGTDRPGHRGEHIEADANDPNADTSDATDANSRAHANADEDGDGAGDSSDLNRRNGHPSGVSGTDGIVTTNTDNQHGAVTHKVTIAHLTPGVTIVQPTGQMTAASHAMKIEAIAFLRQDALPRGKESNQ